ncbi:helix-turn-helix domain-containing protein [Actinomadura sp. 6N118]|uniref:helix-turn-helix domain-containing protein n=1 Tax=Actinomadura sp. 6N118 TaxID=3375151 RepID=UPI00379BC92F
MTKRQTGQIDDGTLEGLRNGDPHALVDQKLISAQNYVVVERAGYNRALAHRAQVIALAHAAGWTKYRIAKRLGITRRAVDEALERPVLSPDEFMAAEVEKNGGHEDLVTRRLRELVTGQSTDEKSER